ncbi:MAG: 5-(carboxyamino)imidazole ribonucleotide synthase [Pirellulales bacterium]
MSHHSLKKQILPGSRLGVFGGGQLGRMFVHAAQRLGYHVAVFDPERNCPAAQAADEHYCPATSSKSTEDLIADFASSCAAVTLEFENVPAEWVRIAEKTTPVRPGADFLAICQDRVREKSSVAAAGLPVTPFMPVTNEDDVRAAGEKFGWPLIVKTVRSGYDGKGQVVIRSETDIAAQWVRLDTNDAIAEQRIDFAAEVSMLGARNATGSIVTYPLIENSHANHILDISRCPVSPELVQYEARAREVVSGIAEAFAVEGLFCVEFFIDRNIGLMVNEIAPRPHNSGHLTIEAFEVSQFEQQVRAMCNLPLLGTDFRRPAAMANLLGDLWYRSAGSTMPLSQPRGDLQVADVLAHRDAHLHFYGKAEARPGRKMGHLTCLSDTAESAVDAAQRLREML